MYEFIKTGARRCFYAEGAGLAASGTENGRISVYPPCDGPFDLFPADGGRIILCRAGDRLVLLSGGEARPLLSVTPPAAIGTRVRVVPCGQDVLGFYTLLDGGGLLLAHSLTHPDGGGRVLRPLCGSGPLFDAVPLGGGVICLTADEDGSLSVILPAAQYGNAPPAFPLLKAGEVSSVALSAEGGIYAAILCRDRLFAVSVDLERRRAGRIFDICRSCLTYALCGSSLYYMKDGHCLISDLRAPRSSPRRAEGELLGTAKVFSGGKYDLVPVLSSE